MATKKVELRQKVNNSFTDEQSEIVVRSDWDIIDNKPDTFVPSDHNHDLSDLNATGNLDNTTYLRGDGQWVEIATTIALEDAAGDGIIWDNVNQEYDVEKATTLQAEAGVNDTAFMTPLKTAQAIEELGGGGATIFKEGKTQDNVVPGDLAQFAGSEGDHYLVKKAVASEINANPDLFMGVFAETAAINDFVKVMWVGLVENVNLPSTTYSLGDILWYDNTNASYTLAEPNTKPIIQIAAVTKVNDGASVTGRLLVRPQFKSRNADEVFMNDNTDLQTKITQVENDIPTNNNELTNGAGYLTAETDPTVPAHVKGITTTNISNWDTAYGWGDHASEGYLTSLPSHTHAISDVTGLQTALDGKATPADITTAVSNLVDSSPATLDTLNELAAALDDDPNFATTVTNSIGTKVSKAGDTMSGALTIYQGGQTALKTYSAFAGTQIIGYQSDSGSPYTKTTDIVANGDVTVPSQMRFFTKANGDSSPSERIKIDSIGNVGIGTDSPERKLHILSDIEEALRLDVTTNTGGIHFRENGTFKGLFGFSNGTTMYTGADADDMVWRSEGKAHIVSNTNQNGITVSGGNVGIGTVSPSTKLDVNGKISNGSIWINNGDDNNSYNENIRLFAAPNGVSVIGFNATGTSGTPVTSILGYNDRLETRVGSAWKTRLYSSGLQVNGTITEDGVLLTDKYTKKYTWSPPIVHWNNGGTDAGYRNILKVTSDTLSTGGILYVDGTSGNVVINAKFEILVNHSQDIVVKSLSGGYTQVRIKVQSGGNDEFNVLMARDYNDTSQTTLNAVFIPYDQNATVTTYTNNPAVSYSTSILTHGTIAFSENITATGGGSGRSYVEGNQVFHDGYHPNADKWTTARTLSLTGDVTGSTSFDGSNNASITVSVLNDSHTHDTRYVQKSGDTMTGTLTYTQLNGPGTSSRDKIRVYNSSSYAIGMQGGISYGGLNDWAMTFQFNDDNDRGFWWGDNAHTTAQGAMSLTTGGRLTVAEGIRVGYGQSDTTTPGTGIQLNGNLDFGSSNGQVKLSRGSYITFYEDGSLNHAIGSRDAGGNEADDLRINSYGAIYLNLDSNNNNTSGADFVIYRHGGTGAMSDTVFSIGGETKSTNFYGQIDLNNNDIYGVDQIFHEGDTNTYMQFHASDQWRVVTGGGERLEVNNSAVTVSNKLVGKINEVNNNVGINFWTGTQAQYDALTPSSTTLYFITE